MLRGIPTYLLLATFVTSGSALAARDETPAAFGRRCIPVGCVAPRSNTPGILARRALPTGRLAGLGATLAFHHGLLAARTTEYAQAGGKATKQPAGKPAAPAPGGAAAKGASAPVTPADVAPLMGTWEIPLETPTGRLVANLVFRTEGGKVVAGVSAPKFAEHKIIDITKSGQVVTLKASTTYSGPLTAYSGPVTMVLTLRPKGPDLAAWFDFNDTGFQLGGTAKKKS